MIQKHLELTRIPMSPWRKIAMGTWRTAADPSVYGIMEVDARPIIAAIHNWRQESGAKVSITHVIGAAVARVMRDHPELNAIIRFARIYQRKSVDIFFQVAADEGGENLSGAVIRNADQKSPIEIARELDHLAHEIRHKDDPQYKKSKNVFRILPPLLARPLLTLLGFILYGLNLFIPALGSPKDPFGSVMITSVGMLGLRNAFAPLVPYSRVPCVIVVGQVQDKPIVEHGHHGVQIIAAPVFSLGVTVDHRVIDGIHAGKMAKQLEHYLTKPELLL